MTREIKIHLVKGYVGGCMHMAQLQVTHNDRLQVELTRGNREFEFQQKWKTLVSEGIHILQYR
jgi:hypothetical protein